MSRPPNEDDGDAGSARARTAAPGDRPRATRGAIGAETAARAAVAMARVVAFKPASDGEAGRVTSVEEGIPGEDSTAREVPAPSNGLARGVGSGSPPPRRVSTLVTRTPPCAESRAPVPRVARRGSSRRLVSSACQTAWGGATGGKKKTSIPLNRRAGSLSRGQSGARRATIRARALTSRVTANVPRAFRADRVGVPRVPPGWVTARRLNGLYLRPHERYLRWRDELSSVASLAFRVYFLTDRHARLMANCVKTLQILTEDPCTAVGFSFSTRGCDGDFENEFQRLASGSAPPSRFTSPRAQVADPHAANPTPRAYHTAPQLEPGARAPATRAAVGQASPDLAIPSP